MSLPQPIYFDDRWIGPHGIGRYALELRDRLPGVVPLRIAGPKLSAIDPIASSWALAGKREGCFLSPGFNAPARCPIPLAFTLHDLIHLQVPEESTPVRRAYYRLVVRPAVRRAGVVLTVSETSRRAIVDWTGIAPEKVVVVGNGVSGEFRPGDGPAVQPERGYFLHVGRRPGYKNVARLLAAFGRCAAARGAGLRLLFTGSADAATLAAAADAGVQDRIDFSGPLTDAQLADCYRGALALVFPSLMEGFGLPVVEAMACGTPVITSTTTATAEIAGPGAALLVDPLDTQSLAEAMDRIATEPALAATLRARGLQRARDFDWERVAQRVCTALERLA